VLLGRGLIVAKRIVLRFTVGTSLFLVRSTEESMNDIDGGHSIITLEMIMFRVRVVVMKHDKK